MSAVSVKGAEIFYSTRGSGPVCLIPSTIGIEPYERMTPPELSDRFKLVYVDLRGTGRSTGEPTDMTYDVLAEDLEAIRVDLGAEQVVVLGHSILGSVAVEYGRRCPETVSHVLAVGTPPSGDMARVTLRASSFFEEDASEERKQILRDSMAKLPKDAPPDAGLLAQTAMRFFDPRFDAASLFAGSEMKPKVLAHLFGTLVPSWDITVGSSSLRVPLFVALGRYDYVIPYVLWEGIEATLPDATVRIFDKSGHTPFLEEPELFVTAVTEWMSRKRRA